MENTNQEAESQIADLFTKDMFSPVLPTKAKRSEEQSREQANFQAVKSFQIFTAEEIDSEVEKAGIGQDHKVLIKEQSESEMVLSDRILYELGENLYDSSQYRASAIWFWLLSLRSVGNGKALSYALTAMAANTALLASHKVAYKICEFAIEASVPHPRVHTLAAYCAVKMNNLPLAKRHLGLASRIAAKDPLLKGELSNIYRLLLGFTFNDDAKLC